MRIPEGLSRDDELTVTAVASKLRDMARDGAGSAGITRRGMQLYAVRENGAWVPRGATPPLMRMACDLANNPRFELRMSTYTLDDALDAALPAPTEAMLI